MTEVSDIETISWITTRSLIKQFFTEEQQKKIDHYFSSKDLSLLSTPKTLFRISHIAPKYSEVLPYIHYSWFVPILQKLPKEEQQCFLSVLPEELSTTLASLISCNPLTYTISPIMQEIIRRISTAAIQQPITLQSLL